MDEYTIIRENGHWTVFRVKGDMAYYSQCNKCGFVHSSWKKKENSLVVEYDTKNEYRYCPMCGTVMEIEL